MLKQKLNEIMRKINSLDPMLEDVYGEESEEYKLREQAISIMKENVDLALQYFTECGAEDFHYFLGFLEEICENDIFYEKILEIEDTYYAKVRGHNIRLNDIGRYLGYENYYRSKYQTPREWKKPITVAYLKEEIESIVSKIIAMGEINEDDYPCLTPEEELNAEAVELLAIDKNKTAEFLDKCNKGILAYFFLDLENIVEEKSKKNLHEKAFNIFFPKEEYVDKKIAKKYLKELFK